jgi:hypothetical protein
MAALVPQMTNEAFEGGGVPLLCGCRSNKGKTLIPWWFWKHRNQHVFEGVAPSVPTALLATREEALLWTMAGCWKEVGL